MSNSVVLQPLHDSPRVRAEVVAAAHVAVVDLLGFEILRAEELKLVVVEPLDHFGHGGLSSGDRIRIRIDRLRGRRRLRLRRVSLRCVQRRRDLRDDRCRTRSAAELAQQALDERDDRYSRRPILQRREAAGVAAAGVIADVDDAVVLDGDAGDDQPVLG